MLAAPAPSSSPVLRHARTGDLAAIERLLTASGLPTAGVPHLLTQHPEDFVVAEMPNERFGASGDLVAVAGLEIWWDGSRDDGVCANALLRSIAVAPAWRAHGLGGALVRRLVGVAEGRGLRALYLLTTTAEHYFLRFGFTRLDRGAVPAEIAATLEFTSACPASATAMGMPLASAPATTAAAAS